MSRSVKVVAAVVIGAFLTLCLSSQSLRAQDHVVPMTDLNQAAAAAASARQRNINTVENFLHSEPVQNAVKKSGYNLKEVQQAVPALSNQELAQLAKTTGKIHNDFAAGALTHEQLTIIIVAAIVIVVILALKA